MTNFFNFKSNTFSEKEKSIRLDKQKQIFYNLLAERTGEIEKLHHSVNFQKWIYQFKGLTKDIDFNGFIDAETLLDEKILKK